MEANDADWAQLIDDALALRKNGNSDGAIELWQDLTGPLGSIIGEGGFSALYTRSVYLTHAAFDWFAPGHASDTPDLRLMNLKLALESGNAAETSGASQMLLLKFIASLASLIGTSLTLRIVSSAWQIDAADLAQSPKEFPND